MVLENKETLLPRSNKLETDENDFKNLLSTVAKKLEEARNEFRVVQRNLNAIMDQKRKPKVAEPRRLGQSSFA